MIEAGCELTIAHEIIDSCGGIMFNKGDKVIVNEVMKHEARWSNVYNMWFDEVIWGVKLEDHYGIMFISCFEEAENIKY